MVTYLPGLRSTLELLIEQAKVITRLREICSAFRVGLSAWIRIPKLAVKVFADAVEALRRR